MKITWKHALFTFLLGVLSFILCLSLSQPYRMYVGFPSMPLILCSFFLMLVSDLQHTGRNWSKFEKLKDEKEFTDYIEDEFKKIRFNFNFKSQMVLGSKNINSRMEIWDDLKKKEKLNDKK